MLLILNCELILWLIIKYKYIKKENQIFLLTIFYLYIKVFLKQNLKNNSFINILLYINIIEDISIYNQIIFIIILFWMIKN